MVLYVKEEMKRNDLPETAVIGLLWTCIMNAVEWNKKEELVAEQALKHLKVQGPSKAVWAAGQLQLQQWDRRILIIVLAGSVQTYIS